MTGLLKSATLKTAAKAFRSKDIRHILLAGPPGVGKTTFFFLMAEYLKMLAWKIQFHAESTPSDMIGMYVPVENGFRWESGPLDLAYSKGGLLILDEIVEASGPCKTFLYGAMDAGKGGTISYVGRTFSPHQKYKVGCTMNGLPNDGSLPDALLDRIDATFLILAPSDQQLALLDSDLREMCRRIYAEAKDPIQGPQVTYRMFRSVQTLRRILPLDEAVMAAMHGDEKLAGAFLETLALSDPPEELAPTSIAAPATVEDFEAETEVKTPTKPATKIDPAEDDAEDDDEDWDDDDDEDWGDEDR